LLSGLRNVINFYKNSSDSEEKSLSEKLKNSIVSAMFYFMSRDNEA